jgi:hypothetical protein
MALASNTASGGSVPSATLRRTSSHYKYNYQVLLFCLYDQKKKKKARERERATQTRERERERKLPGIPSRQGIRRRRWAEVTLKGSFGAEYLHMWEGVYLVPKTGKGGLKGTKH